MSNPDRTPRYDFKIDNVKLTGAAVGCVATADLHLLGGVVSINRLRLIAPPAKEAYIGWPSWKVTSPDGVVDYVKMASVRWPLAHAIRDELLDAVEEAQADAAFTAAELELDAAEIAPAVSE
jgi:hypothetical protein